MATFEKRLRTDGKIIARLHLEKRAETLIIHHENGLTIALDLVETMALINLLGQAEHTIWKQGNKTEQEEAVYADWELQAQPLILDALITDGAHHKQWYLHRIAEALDIDLSQINADEGIAP